MSYLAAGIDWSGSPDAPGSGERLELYVPCGVRIVSIETLNEQFGVWRDELGFAANQELHGYKLRRNHKALINAMEYVIANVQVVAYIFDKRKIQKELGSQLFVKPSRFTTATGLLVCDKLLQGAPLTQIILDEDIARDRRIEFNTAVKRIARSRWPDNCLGNAYPKHQPSHKQSIIQLADIVAYVLSRCANGERENLELYRLVREMRRNQANYVLNGEGGDLQSYL